MKKKFGFTLAEVLITLGIIGVVAALTTPALVKNSGQAKIGPTLAKFVNTVETACEQMMTDEGVSKLSNISEAFQSEELGVVEFKNHADFLEKLSKYIIMSPITDSNVEYVLNNPDGTEGISIKPQPNGHQIWQLKDGSLIISLKGVGFYKKENYTGAYKGPVLFMLYDINGFNGNNRAGKEVFGFTLDDGGSMIAARSQADKVAITHSDLYFKDCSTSSNEWIAGIGCTGKIADNNWKADY